MDWVALLLPPMFVSGSEPVDFEPHMISRWAPAPAVTARAGARFGDMPVLAPSADGEAVVRGA